VSDLSEDQKHSLIASRVVVGVIAISVLVLFLSETFMPMAKPRPPSPLAAEVVSLLDTHPEEWKTDGLFSIEDPARAISIYVGGDLTNERDNNLNDNASLYVKGLEMPGYADTSLRDPSKKALFAAALRWQKWYLRTNHIVSSKVMTDDQIVKDAQDRIEHPSLSTKD
jgi:hypothetical protein